MGTCGGAMTTTGGLGRSTKNNAAKLAPPTPMMLSTIGITERFLAGGGSAAGADCARDGAWKLSRRLRGGGSVVPRVSSVSGALDMGTGICSLIGAVGGRVTA